MSAGIEFSIQSWIQKGSRARFTKLEFVPHMGIAVLVKQEVKTDSNPKSFSTTHSEVRNTDQWSYHFINFHSCDYCFNSQLTFVRCETMKCPHGNILFPTTLKILFHSNQTFKSLLFGYERYNIKVTWIFQQGKS